MAINEYLTELSAKGYCCFTREQIEQRLDGSDIAIQATVRRLKQKGELAEPFRGFYVIVPPEYRILRCRPADHFIPELMEYLKEPYYVGLLSAALYHGAAHHQPQQFQVVINQKRRVINCGQIKIVFITNKEVDKTPVQNFNTSQGIITVSTAESTAKDIVNYPNRCGGLDNVLTILNELAEKLDPNKLSQLAEKATDVAWIQRLGFLLEFINRNELSEVLSNELMKRRVQKRVLAPEIPIPKDANLNSKWKLIINTKLEPD